MNGSSKPISDADGAAAPVASLAGGPLSRVRRLGLPLAAAVGVAVTTAVAARLTVASLPWPLVHDGPLMHYVARRILEGAVPYRDLFDMNVPGVYLVHILALLALGPGDLAFRVFDLTLLALTLAGIAMALRPFGWAAALAGAALFWLYHVAGGAWRAGQRDLILCVTLAWLTAAAIGHVAAGRLRAVAMAGAMLGVAVWIKPHAVLFLPVPLWLAWEARPRGRALAVLGLALAAPTVPVLAWLAVTGALAPFFDVALGYLVPLYSHVGRVSPVTAVREQHLGGPLLAALAVWTALGAIVVALTGHAHRRLTVLLAGVAYGVLHYTIQGKGWEYHLYPLALFMIATGAAGLGSAVRHDRGPAVLVLLAVLGATVGILAVKGEASLAPAWIARKEARVQALTATLAPVVVAGGTVQVLDTTEGGIHVLYRLGARQPTRFLYDFHFYHDVDHPTIQRLRRELVEGLRARPPAAVALFERGWPSGGYERLDGFPALRTWLDDGYELAVEGDGYRVYRPRG